MSDPSVAVQKAVYQALDAGLTVPVYDYVPEGQAYPYVVLEAQTVSDNDYLAQRLDERFFYLSIWSDYRGQKEVLEILSQIDTAMHNQRLALDDGQMVICKVKRKNTSRDVDGVTYMGMAALKIITER